MPRNNTKDIDLGYKRIFKELAVLSRKPYVRIGINQAEGAKQKTDSEEFTVLDVAIVHEFGSRDGRIPQRSFVRATHDNNKRKWNEISKRLKDQILRGRKSVSQALDIMGVKGQGDMRRTIQKGIPPALKPSTIRAKTVGGKKGSTPLIDTGQLIGSIQYEKVMTPGFRDE